jgi:hypothetical protein
MAELIAFNISAHKKARSRKIAPFYVFVCGT